MYSYTTVPWISPWIKSISYELDITVHMIASQLWHHQQSIVMSSAEWKSSEWDMGTMCKDRPLSSFMDSLCHVRNKIMYVLEWRTVSVLTGALLWYLFPLLLRNSGNKHQNNPLVNAETVRHSSTYIIFYSSFHCNITLPNPSNPPRSCITAIGACKKDVTPVH